MGFPLILFIELLRDVNEENVGGRENEIHDTVRVLYADLHSISISN